MRCDFDKNDSTSGRKSQKCHCGPRWESSLLTQRVQDTCPFASSNKDMFQSLPSQLTKSKSKVQSKTLYFKFLNRPSPGESLKGRRGRGTRVWPHGAQVPSRVAAAGALYLGRRRQASWSHAGLAALRRVQSAERGAPFNVKRKGAAVPRRGAGAGGTPEEPQGQDCAPGWAQSHLSADVPQGSSGARPLLVLAGPRCDAAVPRLEYLLGGCGIQMWELRAAPGAT